MINNFQKKSKFNNFECKNHDTHNCDLLLQCLKFGYRGCYAYWYEMVILVQSQEHCCDCEKTL